MNVLRKRELYLQGAKESLKSVNEDELVYVLIKNGTDTYIVTTDIEKTLMYIKKENYSLYYRFLNGSVIPNDSFNLDSLQQSVNFKWFSSVGCYKLNKLQQVDYLTENCGYDYDGAWMLVYGDDYED